MNNFTIRKELPGQVTIPSNSGLQGEVFALTHRCKDHKEHCISLHAQDTRHNHLHTQVGLSSHRSPCIPCICA